MAEAYVWPEGQIAIYTGNGAASAVVAYAQQSQASRAWGWNNTETVGGVYADHLTGKRVTVSVQAMHTFDGTIAKIAESATAVHMKFIHNTVNGSAGVFLYSGRIDALDYAGSEGSPYTWTMQAHFNLWSAF